MAMSASVDSASRLGLTHVNAPMLAPGLIRSKAARPDLADAGGVSLTKPAMFDARHPDAHAAAIGQTLSRDALLPLKVPSDVLGKVGECFASGLSGLQRKMARLDPAAPGWQSELDAVRDEVARLEQFGLQVQQLARVLSGKASLRRERVDLAATARSALAQWQRIAHAGRALSAGAAPASALEVDAAALAQLLDFGIEYALHEGSSVEVDVAMQGQPPRPTLTIRSQRPAAAADDEAEPDEVHWLLFVQLARAIGLACQRVVTEESLALTLRFPAAPEDLPQARAAASPALPHTASAVGRRVLLIEPHDFCRIQAYRLLHDIGVAVDAVSSIEQARGSVGGASPDAVITGIRVDDERCAALLESLRAEQPRLCVIELVDDDDAFSFSVPGSDVPARVGRHDLARTLTLALAQELDAAWPGA